MEQEKSKADSEVTETLYCMYQEAANNARAYMDLRFKHFGTYVVVITLNAGALIKLEAITEKVVAALCGFFITLLFWMLDLRTAQYLKRYWADVYSIENYFREKYAAIKETIAFSKAPKRTGIIQAGKTTNYIFALIAALWLLVFFQRLKQLSEDSPAHHPTQNSNVKKLQGAKFYCHTTLPPKIRKANYLYYLLHDFPAHCPI